MRLVVGITGASGAALAVRTLELLRQTDVETHLIVSKWGRVNLEHECGISVRELDPLVHARHGNGDMASELASGSYRCDATLVLPCSARTLGSIATGTGDTLISRAADVALKERRPLILGLREAPLSSIHLRNALAVSDGGGKIVPLVPNFYARADDLDGMITAMSARLLDHCGIQVPELPRWGETVGLNTGRNNADNDGGVLLP